MVLWTTRVTVSGFKAEVFYDLASKAEKPDMPLLMDEKAPLTVKIWTEKKRYRKGERITIYMKGNKDYFARDC